MCVVRSLQEPGSVFKVIGAASKDKLDVVTTMGASATIDYNKDSIKDKVIFPVNSLTPMSDQDRISPYNINTISSRQMMRMNKKIDQEIIIDPTPNSPNKVTRIVWQA